MTLAAFVIQRPKDGAKVRVRCQMATHSGQGVFSNRHGTHYGVHLFDRAVMESASVEKTSAIGKRVWEICKDGEFHWMTLRLQHIGPDGKPTSPGGLTDGIAITEIVSEK
jgi:hypothetical protein